MKSHLDHIVSNTYSIVKRKQVLSKTFKRIHQLSLLKNFQKWVNFTKLESIVNEELENGSKKLKYMDYEQDLGNLLTFASKSGGYEQKEICEVVNHGEDRIDMLQIRSILTLNSQSDDYLKPLVLQRWKKWVRMRKLFKHWITY